MNLIYIILAAGLSQRFKSKNNIEKQFYLINEKSILEICIENFLELKLNNKLFIVVSETRYNDAVKICNKYNLTAPIIGGKTRQESVFKALKKIKKYNPINVIIHDAARPYINKNIIDKLKNNMKNNVSCIVPTLKVSDAIIKIELTKKLNI